MGKKGLRMKIFSCPLREAFSRVRILPAERKNGILGNFRRLGDNSPALCLFAAPLFRRKSRIPEKNERATRSKS